jgi:hypothetical protein
MPLAIPYLATEPLHIALALFTVEAGQDALTSTEQGVTYLQVRSDDYRSAYACWSTEYSQQLFLNLSLRYHAQP